MVSWTPEWIPTYIGRQIYKQMTESCTPEWIPTYIGRQSGILPSLNHLKGGGGQTWGMERMERGREMWLEDDCLLKLLRNRSGRRSGVPPASVTGLTGAGEVMLDPALVRLKPSNETTKTSRVLGLSIVETRRLMTSHAGANEEGGSIRWIRRLRRRSRVQIRKRGGSPRVEREFELQGLRRHCWNRRRDDNQRSRLKLSKSLAGEEKLGGTEEEETMTSESGVVAGKSAGGEAMQLSRSSCLREDESRAR
ncbi:LOW QUALITY PROTEIN: hypothetical protein HID58_085694 [Brassica napus]|uniref:Uncharacterized protein n=1 Tax=Brassica napus TaxID=3708 RepID=A0ABQ7XNJ6_BRANA|nr:LOW QUALITY PROTEIN: hypothetical protein HID58_085694 [Brassica napus]